MGVAVAVGVTATPIKLPSSRALLNVSVETLICGRMRAPPEMPTAPPLAWGSWETADSILAVVSGAMPPRLRELAADDGSWVMLVSRGWLGDGVSVVVVPSLRDGSVAVVPSAADVAVAVRSSADDVSVVVTLSIEDVVSIAVDSEMISEAEAGSEATLDKLEVMALDSVTSVVSSTSSDVAGSGDEIGVGDESATDEAPVLSASPRDAVAESPPLGVPTTGKGAVTMVAVDEVVSPTISELTTDGLAATDDKDGVVGEATIEDQCFVHFHLAK